MIAYALGCVHNELYTRVGRFLQISQFNIQQVPCNQVLNDYLSTIKINSSHPFTKVLNLVPNRIKPFPSRHFVECKCCVGVLFVSTDVQYCVRMLRGVLCCDVSVEFEP